jgi:hypothetical protein
MITEDQLRVRRDKFERERPEKQSRYRELEKIRREFVSKFPPSRIPLLTLDEYVVGKRDKDVTGSITMAAPEASHIKPWADLNDNERIDPNNGLLLTANLHKLFDAGLISFEDSGKMLVSSKLSQSEREIFGVIGKRLSKKPSVETANYLAYHKTKFLA